MTNWSVLAVDQSASSTGWAHLRHDQTTPTWGVFPMESWVHREGEMLWKWFTWLGHKVTDLQVTHLVLEGTFITPHDEDLTKRIRQYGQIGMADAVAYLCTSQKGQPVDFSVVAPRQWREAFLGRADPPNGLVKHQRRAWLKGRCVTECHKRGWLVDGNDAADALGILAYACSAIDPAFAVKQGPLFRRAEVTVQNEEREMR